MPANHRPFPPENPPMRTRLPVLLALLSCSILLACRILPAAERWPQFLGPEGNARAEGARLPVEFSEDEHVRWKVPIHGRGWSSPVIWDDQIWMTTATRDGKKMFAVCVDRRSGRMLHDILVFENEKPRYCEPSNSYASPTPVIEAGRVYVHFGSYGTACLDTSSGEVLWQRRDLPCNHWRGPGSSPVLAGDRLIIPFDGYDLQYVVALDKATGATVWKRDREIDYGTTNGDRKKAYATGTIVRAGGVEQVVIPSAAATVSYEVASGEEVWRVRHGGMNACARPQLAHGMVFVTTGSNSNLLAIHPDGRGDVTESRVAWKGQKGVPQRPTPIVVGDHVYTISDAGVVSCADARTGKLIWQERVGGKYRASPLYADGRIYFFDMDGECAVIEAGSEYKLLARNKLENGCQASPAVAGDELFVRTTTHLYCIGR